MPVDVSIVATLYRSSPFVDEFIDRAAAAANQLGGTFEIILVDDGSPDDSLAKAAARAARDPRVRVLELTRNFGHHTAILAGLEDARGARVFLVDSDLEEPPELLLEFAHIMDKTGCDVVYGLHTQQTGGWARRVTSSLFWPLFSAVAEVKLERNICMVRLMRRHYLDALLSLRERNLFLAGMFAWPGFKQEAVMIERKLRRSQSTYSPLGRLALFARSIIAFSVTPLYSVFFLGLFIAAASFVAAAGLLIQKLLQPETVLFGFATIMISIWFLGGVTISTLGLIGLYVGQIYKEVKQRPRHFVRRVHGTEPSP